MKNQVDLIGLQSQVQDCYSFFVQNHQTSNFDHLEEMLTKLQETMIQLTVTNLVNIIDRVIEDGRINNNGQNRQYNISSLQIIGSSVSLICHEVIGFDNIDKKYVLDSDVSYIDFTDVVRMY
ncbi:hypothetical protein [Arcobacter sp. LA11]|uniref:hypothetical protein n=1 Tax=Arcobacter sp. LA11 TaxID=1898176 RepID=UPI000932AFEC|nr:hypothetical protein [Arcobacter sp. LA11]